MNFYVCVNTSCCARPMRNGQVLSADRYFFSRLVYTEQGPSSLISLAERMRFFSGGYICHWHGKKLEVKRSL